MSDDDVRAELAALADRVAALEKAARESERSEPAQPATAHAHHQPPPGTVDAALIERLQSRSGPPFEDAGSRGSVLYAGAVQLGGAAYAWQVERPVPGLLATDDQPLATALAALASPTRLQLIKAVLAGATEAHELQRALGDVSPGQLYHHLKELTAAGLVVQQSRGRYQVAPHCVVPLLAVIAAAYDLTNADPTTTG